ncbi:MAG: hypothetical protein HY868_11410 [Chloroflexi bacterium]|nr:hypothetical protein [Chloroflexota bacterium]
MKPPVRKCVIDTRVYQAALEFAGNLERDEWGGIGIGTYMKSGEAYLKGIVFPPQYRSNSAYCAFEMKYLALLKFALGDLGIFPQVTMIAWVHSHPGHGIFLSDIDRETFGDLLSENERLLALVIEPVQREIGAFIGVQANEQVPIPVEQRELGLSEDQRIRLSVLESMLPEMPKVIVPPLPSTFSAHAALEVAYTLSEKVVRLRRWLAISERARGVEQAQLSDEPA